MKRGPLFCLGCFLWLLAGSARGGVRPNFSLDNAAWDATHIVVVEIVAPGTFKVLESWKGDLPAGSRLIIPPLKPAATAHPIAEYPRGAAEAIQKGFAEQYPRQPAGAKMILFFTAETVTPVAGKTGRAARPQLKSPDFPGNPRASVAWVEGAELWCFVQPENPGPSVLTPCGEVEAAQRRVVEVVGLQREIAAAAEEPDGRERAARLKPYLHMDFFRARRAALRALGSAGVGALPVIHEMLDDPTYAAQKPELINAMAESGGEAAAPELRGRLQQEVAFWKATGPSLALGWWNDDPDLHAPLRERYAETLQLVQSLRKIQDAGAAEMVSELRDLWRSLPQLNDSTGISQLADECDRFLEGASAKREP